MKEYNSMLSKRLENCLHPLNDIQDLKKQVLFDKATETRITSLVDSAPTTLTEGALNDYIKQIENIPCLLAGEVKTIGMVAKSSPSKVEQVQTLFKTAYAYYRTQVDDNEVKDGKKDIRLISKLVELLRRLKSLENLVSAGVKYDRSTLSKSAYFRQKSKEAMDNNYEIGTVLDLARGVTVCGLENIGYQNQDVAFSEIGQQIEEEEEEKTINMTANTIREHLHNTFNMPELQSQLFAKYICTHGLIDICGTTLYEIIQHAMLDDKGKSYIPFAEPMISHDLNMALSQEQVSAFEYLTSNKLNGYVSRPYYRVLSSDTGITIEDRKNPLFNVTIALEVSIEPNNYPPTINVEYTDFIVDIYHPNIYFDKNRLYELDQQVRSTPSNKY